MATTMMKPFGSITRRTQRNNKEFKYLETNDKRMRFNNSKDPIYYVFHCIENRPVKTLAKEFVKDSVLEIANFVSKVVG